MLWNLLQRSFNGGQLDSRLMGRTDLSKYYQGASTLENFIVKRQGCISRRPGTKILHTINRSDFAGATHFRVIPFSYELSGGYVIVMYAADYGAATCLICDSSGLGVDEITVPYRGKAIEELDYCQSGDTLFLAHRSYPFAHIIRRETNGVTTWTYRTVDFETLDHLAVQNPPDIASIDKSGFTGTGQSVTVEYCATSVKDGVESSPSSIKSISYATPWIEGAKITLSINKNPQEDVDSYNIYKRRQGRSWGFVGAEKNGPEKYYNTPVDTFDTEPFIQDGSDNDVVLKFNDSAPQPSSTPFFHSDKIEMCSSGSTGRVFANGYARLQWVGRDHPTPQPITTLYVGLGYAMMWTKNLAEYPYWTYLGQFIPCKVKKVRAIFNLDDGTSKTIEARVPSSVMKDDIIIEDDHNVSSQLKDASPDVWLAFNLYTPGHKDPIKKVNDIRIYAYLDDDCTIPAIGSINMPADPGVEPATLVGSPFVIRGVYCTTLTVEESDGLVKFVDDYIEPDLSVTPPKYEPFFDKPGKYPGCVTLYQQRLVLASTDDQPFTFWMSCIGDIYNFNTHDSLREDDAIEVTLPATKYPNINRVAVNRDLILFCDNGEWIVSPIAGNAMTFSTISTRVESQIGSSHLHQPIIVGNDVLFVNTADETLVATKYDFTSDSYGTQDLSVLSHDIFRNNPITSIAYAKNPDSLVIATLKDGSFATLTYMKEHEVVAWSVHRLADGVKALAVATDGSLTDGATNVFLLDGQGHILIFTPVPEIATDPLQLVSLDFKHEVEAGGRQIPTGCLCISTDGQVFHPGETTVANGILGYKFASKLVTVRPEPSPQETVQFEIKNPTRADIRTHGASSFAIGQLGMPRARDRIVEIPQPSHSGGKWTAPDVDVAANIAGANGRDGRMILQCDGPWPLTVLSLATTYQIEKADQNPGGGA